MSRIKEFAESLSVRIMQTGSYREEPVRKILNAGNLTAVWVDGTLRDIKAGGRELLRMIYPALRDKDWQTVSPEVENEDIVNGAESFTIKLRCRYRTKEINFTADYTFEGTSENCITVMMEGHAIDSFQKNRIGWCVLHPVEGCSGERCLVEHINGSREQSFFPVSISPYQVFTNIRALNWSHGGINCRLEFEGDNFETEDQRNWTDDSYKTYSTPLTLPYPATVEKGTSIFQKVTFRADGDFGEQDPEPGKTVLRLFPDVTFRLPEIGIGRKSGQDSSLMENEIKILRSLRFDHYRVDIHLSRSDWQKDADEAATESHDLGFPVELALFFDDNYSTSLRSFITWYQSAKITISSILLFHVSLPIIPDERAGEIIRSLRETDPDLWVATGTNANFAQLNRNRPGDSRNDSICFSIHPQEHLSDNITIIENLRAQGYAVSGARGFGGNKKITVSPVNIQKRYNANKSLYEATWTGSGIPPQVDSRQMSLLGACWTAISIKYLGEAGADSVTYYETAGERGIIQGDKDSQWPSAFKTVSGMIFPVYHVFRFILGNKNLTGIKSVSSDPVAVDSLALSDGRQARIILVNFTDNVRRVRLECCSGLFRIRTLCTACFAEAAENMRWSGIENEKVIQSEDNFDLEPYSINFIEGWKKR